MDEAVDGISKERNLIFNSFALGLGGNLCTVLAVCFIIMDGPTSYVACAVVLYTASLIYYNSNRILSKFVLHDTIRLDDLTQHRKNEMFGNNSSHGLIADGSDGDDEETGGGGGGYTDSKYTIPLPGKADNGSNTPMGIGLGSISASASRRRQERQ